MFPFSLCADECNQTAPPIYPRRGVIRPPRRHSSQAGWDWDVTQPRIQPTYVCPTATLSQSPTPTPYVNHTLIPVTSGVAHKWFGAVYHQARVWACPYYESSILVFDPNTHHYDTLDVSAYAGSGYFAGTNLVGDKVVCTPYNAPHVLILDTLTNTTTTISTGGVGKWVFGAVVGARVYMCPTTTTDSVGVYDSSANTFTTIGSGMPSHPGCPAVGGTLVMSATPSNVGVFDTATATYRTVPTGVSSAWYNDPCVVGTKVYMLPWSSTTVIVYDAITDVASPIATTITSRGPCINYSGGYLIGTPMKNDQRLYIFDTHLNTTTELISNLGYTSDATDQDYRGGVAVDNKVILIPQSANEIIVVELQL